MTTYGIQKELEGSFEDAITKTKKALIHEGFGVLTEIDVKQTLRRKLQVNYPNYIILGACHPQSAYEALKAEKEIGLLLPCNIIIYEHDGKIVVCAISPTAAMQIVQNQRVAQIARKVERKLQKVIKSI